MVWLDADLQWQAHPSGRTGRPAVFSDAAIQFCLTPDCMFGLGLRQTTGLAESLLQLAGLDCCARLQHPVSAPEDLERDHHCTTQQCRPASTDRQHRREDAG